MKHWIEKNLIINNKLIPKRCRKQWFENCGYDVEYQRILTDTSFLDDFNPSFLQRIWHIINEKKFIKCSNPTCNNPPTFLFFKAGYLKNCSGKCAQNNPETQNKIKSTNITKYGTEYGLSNKIVIEKRKQSCLKHYGVDNPTKSNIVLDKIKKNNLNKYGVEWILCDQKKKENAVYQKYGVKNVQQFSEIRKKTIQTRRGDFFDSLFTSDRLNNRATPLFNKEEYVSGGLYKKYKFKCNVCETEFLDCLEDGDLPRCPVCYKGKSNFEKDVFDYIQSILPVDTEIVENDKKTLISGKELDIYVPKYKIAIECDGLYWHSEVSGNKDKQYHKSKTIECERIGVKLIHIFEDEWCDKTEIVKSKIRHIFRIGFDKERKIYARECKIRNLHNNEKKIFLDENHIQGNDISSISLGLFLKGQLVAAMTLSKNRIFTNPKNRVEDEYELSRYAALKDCSVIGGAGKLLSYFIKNYKPKKIISYADRRWTSSENNLYEKIGFIKVTDGVPNYWYFGVGDSYRRHHRFAFAKHTLSKKLPIYDPNISEWQNMQNNGWDRIWDCGNLKYEMVI